MTVKGTLKYDCSSPSGKKIVREVFARFAGAPIERSDIARIAREHAMPSRAIDDGLGRGPIPQSILGDPVTIQVMQTVTVCSLMNKK
jgi:hypothetical protein